MKTTNFVLKNDIIAFCVKASSFPDGVLQAHQKLHSLVKHSDARNYFGISHANQQNQIIYKAGVDEIEPGELKEFGLEQVVIKSGDYLSISIADFKENISEIEEAFKYLISQPNIDPHGFCLEWYSVSGKDCQCLIRVTNY